MRMGLKRFVREYLTEPEGIRFISHIDGIGSEIIKRRRFSIHGWMYFAIYGYRAVEDTKYWINIETRIINDIQSIQ